MKTPTLGYCIWFTQRSGSTFLCELLSNTQALGHPGEHLAVFGEETLLKKWNATDYRTARKHFWEFATSSNGVCGLKKSLQQDHFDRLIQQAKHAPGAPEINSPIDFLNDWLPNCKHVYLTRRHRIRQVVSWWRAIKDETWHLRGNNKIQHDQAWYDAHYDFDALNHLFKETILMDCAQQRFFDQHGIKPMTIVYEDFIQDLQGTINQFLDYLEIEDINQDINIPDLKKTRTDRSEIWVERFANDLQTGWDHKAF